MRKLHPVGLTDTRDGLILSTRKGAKTGTFVVPIGDDLRSKLAEAAADQNGFDAGDSRAAGSTGTAAASGVRTPEPARAIRPQSTLTPREIQARLRAGRTIEEVAGEAEVTPEWVERFAPPVVAEQAQIVQLARGLTYTKPRLGESAETLGEAVIANLADRGVVLTPDEYELSWTAYQVREGRWVVRVRYRSRGRTQEAAWELDVAAGTLSARNRLGTDLGYAARPTSPGRAVPATGDQIDGEGTAPDESGEAPLPGRRPRRAAADPGGVSAPVIRTRVGTAGTAVGEPPAHTRVTGPVRAGESPRSVLARRIAAASAASGRPSTTTAALSAPAVPARDRSQARTARPSGGKATPPASPALPARPALPPARPAPPARDRREAAAPARPAAARPAAARPVRRAAPAPKPAAPAAAARPARSRRPPASTQGAGGAARESRPVKRQAPARVIPLPSPAPRAKRPEAAQPPPAQPPPAQPAEPVGSSQSTAGRPRIAARLASDLAPPGEAGSSAAPSSAPPSPPPVMSPLGGF